MNNSLDPAPADRGTLSPKTSASPANGGYAKGVGYCLVATVSFGFMFPVMTGALTHIDPFTFTSLRYLLAGTAFLILLLVKEGASAFRSRGESIILAWLFGSIGFAGFGFLVFRGQQLAGPDGALTASIMMAIQPMLGLLVNSVVRRMLPPLYSAIFILLSFCGVALVVTKGDITGLLNEPQHYSANMLIVLGALCWVIYTFGATFFTKWSVFKYTTVTTWLGLSTVLAINLALLASHTIPVPRASDLRAIVPHLIYMGLIAGFMGVLCWNLGNRILTPLNGVLFMDVVPVTTFVVSTIVGVIPTYMQIVGATLTGTALVLNNLYLRRRPN